MAIDQGLNQAMKEHLLRQDPNMDHEQWLKMYRPARYAFIALNEEGNIEGSETCYEDGKGCRTVGIGFNMDSKIAREEWNAAFAGVEPKPDFDQVRAKKQSLNDGQIFILFNYGAEQREQELMRAYGNETWTRLKANERLAIEDAYYNGGGDLVGRGTRFHKNIGAYAKTGDEVHLNNALWELAHNSNAERTTKIGKGIQNRRDVEAELLNTYNVDIDSLPEPDYIRQQRQAKQDENRKKKSADTKAPAKKNPQAAPAKPSKGKSKGKKSDRADASEEAEYREFDPSVIPGLDDAAREARVALGGVSSDSEFSANLPSRKPGKNDPTPA